MAAEVWITGTGATQKIHFRLPSGSKGDPGDKGDPGGWVTAAPLGTANLDSITTPGTYSQIITTNGTLVNNYPADQVAGHLHVTADTYPRITQVFYPANSTMDIRIFWVRHKNGPTWYTWKLFTSTRTVNTVGKRIMQWDETTNTEIMIYGKTGLRRGLAELFKNGITAVDGDTSRLSRNNDTVTLYLSITSPAGWVSGTTAFSLPAGFRPQVNMYMPQSYSVDGPSILTVSGDLNLYAPVGTYRYLWSWETKDVWPTALPGIAA